MYVLDPRKAAMFYLWMYDWYRIGYEGKLLRRGKYEWRMGIYTDVENNNRCVGMRVGFVRKI